MYITPPTPLMALYSSVVAYVSSTKVKPKYCFSFRLKWDETKSRSSRDNSFGCGSTRVTPVSHSVHFISINFGSRYCSLFPDLSKSEWKGTLFRTPSDEQVEGRLWTEEEHWGCSQTCRSVQFNSRQFNLTQFNYLAWEISLDLSNTWRGSGANA